MKQLLVIIILSATSAGWGQVISQYVETNSGTTPKGIEIWNNTGGTLDFSTNNLVIEKGTNGGTPSADFTLSSGTLGAGKVIVIGTSDLQTTTENNGSVFHSKGFTFNGNDALVVKYGGTITDIFGNPNSDPGSAWSGNGVSSANQNIALLNEITTGDTDGWTDPSERFETVSSDPVGGGGIDGFGIAPTAHLWTGTSSSAWTNVSNWAGGTIPTSVVDIIIPDGANNNPTISTSDVVCNRLTVNSSRILTIGASASINISAINNNGTIIMQSSATTSAALKATSISGSGTYKYQKYVAGSSTNDLITAPFSGETFSSLVGNNSGVLVQNTSPTTEYLFGPFDNDTGEYLTYDSTTNALTVLSAGQGYRAGTTSGATLEFTGTFETTNQTVAINEGSDGTYGKWNLVGNPFPSYLDLDGFLDDNNTGVLEIVNTAVYAYDGDDSNGSNWTIYSLNETSNVKIAPGQAFFVASSSGGGNLNFNTSRQTVTGGDDFLVPQAQTIDSSFKLKLESSNSLTHTDFYFNSNAGEGLDIGYDVGTYANLASSFSLYSKLASGEYFETNFAIQTISNDLSETVVIPLGVHTSAGESHSISIDDVSLLESINVYLKDYETGALTLLNNGAYSFSTDSNLEGISRFELRLTNTTLGIESDELITNFKAVYQNGGVVLVGDFNLDDKVEIYDIMGRLTQSHTIGGNHSIEINKDELANGVYLAKINRKGNSKTIKFIIN